MYSFLVFATFAGLIGGVVLLVISKEAVTLGLLRPVEYRKRVAIVVVTLLTLCMGLCVIGTGPSP